MLQESPCWGRVQRSETSFYRSHQIRLHCCRDSGPIVPFLYGPVSVHCSAWAPAHLRHPAWLGFGLLGYRGPKDRRRIDAGIDADPLSVSVYLGSGLNW